MSLIRLGSASTRRQVIKLAGNHSDRAEQYLNDSPITGDGQPVQLSVSTETTTETEKAFQQIVQYFPTETVTLFLAAVSLVTTLDYIPWVAQLRPFWLIALFAILTPLMLLLAAYATFREEQNKQRIPVEAHFVLPKFDLIASSIAFIPWALAVPGLFPETVATEDQIQGGWTTEVAQVVAAFLAFAVSWLLSQLRRIFQSE